MNKTYFARPNSSCPSAVLPACPLACYQMTAGRIAKEFRWTNKEFSSGDIIPPWFFMLIYARRLPQFRNLVAPHRHHQLCILYLWVSYDSHNSDYYFPKQHYTLDLCICEGLCSLWGTDWILKYYLDELPLQSVNISHNTKTSNSKT
jgi:hypothetical protein